MHVNVTRNRIHPSQFTVAILENPRIRAGITSELVGAHGCCGIKGVSDR